MKGVVAAVVSGMFIIAAILIYRYTSPFEQCVRHVTVTMKEPMGVALGKCRDLK